MEDVTDVADLHEMLVSAVLRYIDGGECDLSGHISLRPSDLARLLPDVPASHFIDAGLCSKAGSMIKIGPRVMRQVRGDGRAADASAPVDASPAPMRPSASNGGNQTERRPSRLRKRARSVPGMPLLPAGLPNGTPIITDWVVEEVEVNGEIRVCLAGRIYRREGFFEGQEIQTSVRAQTCATGRHCSSERDRREVVKPRRVASLHAERERQARPLACWISCPPRLRLHLRQPVPPLCTPLPRSQVLTHVEGRLISTLSTKYYLGPPASEPDRASMDEEDPLGGIALVRPSMKAASEVRRPMPAGELRAGARARSPLSAGHTLRRVNSRAAQLTDQATARRASAEPPPPCNRRQRPPASAATTRRTTGRARRSLPSARQPSWLSRR